MAQPAQEPPLLAVVVAIEASLAVAQQWVNTGPAFEYTINILKRLSESHPNTKVKLGIVAYGPPDTLPSPLLSNTFFGDLTTVFKQLAGDPVSFGIGSTGSGATRGMAVLDALVAALEMFDTFSTILAATNKSHVGHILHVASSPPDPTRRPYYNQNTAFDDLGWETLPAEMQKRNIGYTVISRKPLQGKLMELTHAINSTSDPIPAWFNDRSPYTLYASPTLSQPPLKSSNSQHVKRSSETPATVDRTPEPKRQRIQSGTDSPKPAPAPPRSQPQPTPVPPQPTPPSIPQPQPQPQPQPLQQPTPPAPTPPQPLPQQLVPPQVAFQRFQNAVKAMQENIRMLEMEVSRNDISQAEKEAKLGELVAKRQQQEKMLMTFKGFQQQRNNMVNQMQAAARLAAAQQGQNGQQPQAGSSNQASAAFDMMNTNLPAGIASAPMPSTQTLPSNPQDIMAAAQLQHARTLSGTFPTQPNPPSMNLQIQKMLEQKARSGALMGHTGMGLGITGVGMPNNGQQPGQVPGAAGIRIWNGTLNWPGTSSGIHTEIQLQMVGLTKDPVKAQGMTWPTSMHIAMAQETFPLKNLEIWLSAYPDQFALCWFLPDPNASPDPVQNKKACDAILGMLHSQQIYATGSWTTPTGAQTRNMLFFPMTGRLGSVVFPQNGLPPLPPKQPLTDAMVTGLRQMSPAQRIAMFEKIANNPMMQRFMPRPGMPGNGSPQFGMPAQIGGQPMNPMLGMMGGTGLMNHGLRGPIPGGGTNVPPGVSMEMLQSFMQRKDGQ